MRYLLVIFAVLIGGCANAEEFKITNAPTSLVEIQIKQDYELMKTIYEIFPSNKKKLIPLKVWVAHTEIQSQIGMDSIGFYIHTQNNRGIWMHELMHYFTNQLDASDSNEFAHEVLENIVNGIDANTYRRYFKYNKNSIYKDRNK